MKYDEFIKHIESVAQLDSREKAELAVSAGGTIGAAIAKLFGEAPKQQIGDDLNRFKMLMEAGEIATTEGQPKGGS